MKTKCWDICTPDGYLLERACGTKEQANKWASDHYIVWRILPSNMCGRCFKLDCVCRDDDAFSVDCGPRVPLNPIE